MTAASTTSTWALAAQISSQYCAHSSHHADSDTHTAPHIPSHFILPLHHRPSGVDVGPPHAATAPSVPIIDLACCYDDDLLLRQIHSACSHWGLFHVVNHSVPDSLLCQLQSQIEMFLALPISERCPRFLGNRGEGYGTGFIRSSTGIMEWRDCLRLSTFPVLNRNYDDWPLNPQFRKALEDFSDETRKLQLKMLYHLSRSLGLTASRLEEIVGEMQQTILMNHYPPCPQPDMAAGIDNHTDIGAISCLWQYDDVVGLHVLYGGNWVAVKSPPSSLTIIVGDQVQIASNGIFKSPIHRAVLSRTKHRVSMVSFYQLKSEQVVAPAAELVVDEQPPLYPPTKFKDHELASKGPVSS